MLRKTTLIAAALATGAAFPALAGSITPVEADPVIIPAAPVAPASPNWTGFYAGGQLGYADVNGDGTLIPAAPFSANGDDMIGGLIAGYDYDLGDWVVGAGIDYDWTDIGLSTAAVPGLKMDNIWRLKLRGGYKIGNGLLYGTGGYANADTNLLGDADGYFIGAGYEHMLTQNFSIGGEVLYHQFDNFKNIPGGVADYDADVTTAQVRATFRF